MKSVVFCSSQRFRKELEDFINELKQAAKKQKCHLVILDPEFEERGDLEKLEEKERLFDKNYRSSVAGKVYDHLFRKVKVADICFVFNKDGYIGANTNGELFAAAITGKICYALEDKILMGKYPNDLYEEPSPRKLIHEIVKTPEALLERLL